MLLDDADSEYDSAAVQPRRPVACAVVREKRSTPHDPGDRQARGRTPWPTGGPRPPGDWDHWPAGRRLDARRLARCVLVADEDGRAPVFRRRPRDRRVHPADRRRLRLLRRAGLARRQTRLRDADVVRRAAAARAPRRHARPTSTPTPLRGPSATPALPGRLEEVETTAEDGTRVRSWLALPEDASADKPGAAAAVDPRRPAGLVERVVVALEPVDRRRPRVRRAAARPGAVHRLRPRLHPPRLGQLGRRRRTPT